MAKKMEEERQGTTRQKRLEQVYDRERWKLERNSFDDQEYKWFIKLTYIYDFNEDIKSCPIPYIYRSQDYTYAFE